MADAKICKGCGIEIPHGHRIGSENCLLRRLAVAREANTRHPFRADTAEAGLANLEATSARTLLSALTVVLDAVQEAHSMVRGAVAPASDKDSFGQPKPERA